jgi:hypothetical protein
VARARRDVNVLDHVGGPGASLRVMIAPDRVQATTAVFVAPRIGRRMTVRPFSTWNRSVPGSAGRGVFFAATSDSPLVSCCLRAVFRADGAACAGGCDADALNPATLRVAARTTAAAALSEDRTIGVVRRRNSQPRVSAMSARPSLA